MKSTKVEKWKRFIVAYARLYVVYSTTGCTLSPGSGNSGYIQEPDKVKY
jgi:hypothetical protein